MAAGAGDVRLQLGVTLDLASFRQQLAAASRAAASYYYPINFDKTGIDRQFAALDRQFKRRNYRLEVATNLAAEIKSAGTLAKALRGLDNAIQKNKGIVNRAVGGAAGATIDAGRVAAMINRATKPALQALYGEMSKAGIPMTDVGRGTVDSLRRAILSGVPQLTADLAQGIANGINPKMKENGTSGAKLFVDAFKSATGIASPSKVFKALGEFSADGLEIGFLNGLKDFKTKAVNEIRQIVALMKLELASLGSAAMGPGARPVRADVRGGTQYMSPIGPLPEGSREPWAWNRQAFRYSPYMAQPDQFREFGVPAMRTRQPFLPAPPVMGTISSPGMLGQARLALPAAGETSAIAMREAALALREFTARQRSDARSASVMGENRMWSRVAGQVPVGAGGPFLPPGAGGGIPPLPPSGGAESGGGMGGFGRALGAINLPGTGVVREIGNEFAMATKQVLLFGTAYKGLAFITSFPAQVGEAVGALQNFNNTLKAISPSADEVAASNEFILNTVDKYNVPLQSARDGFTKLYASMQPAGFSGNEVRDLFLGISKAAATFGMSADKVDRVTYAFAQMASKGQVMSEELKGQLGDVLPGAMGIFAKAAGFEGPSAIQKFSKALEDGAYKGGAMRELLKNVTIELNKEFGPGAEGAAKTFQGVMNRMANSTKLFYEAFEPLAVGFLNQVVVPITGGIKTIADGFTSFFQGVEAKTFGGEQIAAELNALRPAFDGIIANVAQLMPLVGQLGSMVLAATKAFVMLAGNPVVGFLVKVYLQTLLLTTAFKVLTTNAIAQTIRSLVAMVTQLVATRQAMLSTQLQMALLASNAGGLTVAFRSGALAVTGLGVAIKTALLSGIVTAAIVVIDLLIGRIQRLRAEADAVKAAGKGAEQEVKAAYAGGVQTGRTFAAGKEAEAVSALRLSKIYRDLAAGRKISEGDFAFAQGLGADLPGVSRLPQGGYGAQAVAQMSVTGGVRTVAPGLREELERQSLLQAERAENIRQGVARGQRAGETSAAAQAARDAQNRAAATGDVGAAQTKVDKAAERAALEAQRLQAIERQLNEELRIRLRTLQIDESIAAARADQDDEKVAEFESDKRMLDIGIRRARIQKDFDAGRIKAAEYKLRLQLLEIDRTEEQKKYEEDLNKIFRERFGITDAIARAAREARERGFGAGAGTGTFRTDIDLMPGLTGGPLGEAKERVKEELSALMNPVNQLIEAANNIGKAFGDAFKGMVNGSMTAQQALASFFQSIGDYFLDMASRMIAKWIEMQIIGLAKSLLPGGSALFPNGVSNFSGAFGAGGPVFQPSAFAANGAVWQGGFTPFANGGIVTGPTLGLVGEGRFNEAIVPLPNGKSIPVDLGDGAGNNISTNIVINVSNGQAQSSMTGGGASDFGRKMEGAVKQVIVNELRPGGVLAGARR